MTGTLLLPTIPMDQVLANANAFVGMVVTGGLMAIVLGIQFGPMIVGGISRAIKSFQ